MNAFFFTHIKQRDKRISEQNEQILSLKTELFLAKLENQHNKEEYENIKKVNNSLIEQNRLTKIHVDSESTNQSKINTKSLKKRKLCI